MYIRPRPDIELPWLVMRDGGLRDAHHAARCRLARTDRLASDAVPGGIFSGGSRGGISAISYRRNVRSHCWSIWRLRFLLAHARRNLAGWYRGRADSHRTWIRLLSRLPPREQPEAVARHGACAGPLRHPDVRGPHSSLCVLALGFRQSHRTAHPAVSERQPSSRTGGRCGTERNE